MITQYHTADLLMFCEDSRISRYLKFPTGVIKTLDFVIVRNIVLQKHFVSYLGVGKKIDTAIYRDTLLADKISICSTPNIDTLLLKG